MDIIIFHTHYLKNYLAQSETIPLIISNASSIEKKDIYVSQGKAFQMQKNFGENIFYKYGGKILLNV